MALTKCPECTKEVSSQATACPHCGYPLASVAKPAQSSSAGPQHDATPTTTAARPPATGAGKGCGGCLAVAIIAIIVMVIIGALTPKDPNYEAGKQKGEEISEAMLKLSGKGFAGLGFDFTIQQAKIHCPNDLSGEARQKWIEGFISVGGYR